MTPSEQTAREIAKEIVTSSGLTMTERDMIISVELVKKITEALERERRELELIKKEIKPHENLASYIKEWEELDDERIARIKELEAKLKAAEAEAERLRAENESHKKFCESILTSPPQAVKETESVILICSKCGKDCDDLGEHIFCNKCLDKMIPEPSHKKAERWVESSAILCNHANEVPSYCNCPKTCYCKSHSCKGEYSEKEREALERVVTEAKKEAEYRRGIYASQELKDALADLDRLRGRA